MLDQVGDEKIIKDWQKFDDLAGSRNVAEVAKLWATGYRPPTDFPTALYTSAASGSLALVKFFVEQGEDPNRAVNDNGWTPLMIAASRGYAEIVAQLLQAGANPSYVSSTGEDALMLAARESKPAVVELLSQVTPVPLTILLDLGKVDEVRRLVRSGDFSAVDRDGKSVIPGLFQKRQDDLAKQLLNETTINVPNRDGFAPLHVAILRNDVKLARYLLERGANPNANSDADLDVPPLMLAARHASCEMLTLLHEYKTNIEMLDPYGWTALLHAIDAKRPVNVECLLRLGADVHVTYPLQDNGEGDTSTALEMAQKLGSPKIKQVLLCYM